MKKEKLLKALIVLFGTGLTYLKYNLNEFLNVDYIMLVVAVLFVSLILAVYILNYKVYGFKTFVTNQKLMSIIPSVELSTELKKERVKSTSIQSKTQVIRSILEPISFVLVASGLGSILGFYYKRPSARLLNYAFYQPSEWKKNLFLDQQKAETNFFELYSEPYGGYEFNWFACLAAVLVIILVYIIIKKTTIINVLKSKVKPYLK